MAQKHTITCIEKPMTVGTTTQGPQKRYRRLRFPSFEAAVWAEKNPLLQKGELGHEKDTGRFKVGDGITYWVDLPYNSVGDPAKINGYNVLEIVAGKNVEIEQNGNVLTIGASGTGYSKQEIDDKIVVINADIDANADAIQKTRDDMNAEDGRLQTQITAYAGAITALQNEQTATGNQLQTIESKIPEDTSETNPLVNSGELTDYVKNTDYASANKGGVVLVKSGYGIGHNTSAGLYTIQASEAAIDKKTNQYVPITPKVLDYAVKSGVTKNTIELTDEEKATAQAWLGVAGKVDVAGDTMTGTLNVPELNVQTAEGTLNMSITAGVATIATNNGLDIVSQTKFDTAPTTDDTTAWADANLTALVSKRQVADALASGASGLTSVATDDTITGDGTLDNPLSVADALASSASITIRDWQ